VRILFLAGCGPIVKDTATSLAFYRDTLGIPFEESDDYFHTEAVGDLRAFALWPLSQAAQSCFGTDVWPAEVPEPQTWMEFDVEDIAAATEELTARGYKTLVANRTEPWGQIVTRVLSPEGLLIGLSVTPWMRKPQAAPVTP
jgi:catechol 2,3-dioxygenase-like lactoylglutathione lyase family enzyme